MKTILLLDDDLEICELLQEYLVSEGYAVKVFHTPSQVLQEPYEATCDLCIIDIMLPEMSGFEVLKRIREKSKIPIIMLTARGEELDRILGLELGADDYLAKPFSPRELVARMKAVFRRVDDPGKATSEETPDMLKVGDLTMFPASRKVLKGTDEIVLTGVEFKLLELFLQSPGKILKRQDLALQALERTLSYDDRSLDVHISNLRRKIGSKTPYGERIQTIRSTGYLFAVFPEEEYA
jgi:two-component system response regulator CpxR